MTDATNPEALKQRIALYSNAQALAEAHEVVAMPPEAAEEYCYSKVTIDLKHLSRSERVRLLTLLADAHNRSIGEAGQIELYDLI